MNTKSYKSKPKQHCSALRAVTEIFVSVKQVLMAMVNFGTKIKNYHKEHAIIDRHRSKQLICLKEPTNMTPIVLICLALFGLVASEAGEKGYSPKYNLKTYGNPFGPGNIGSYGYQGNGGFGYPSYGRSGYGYGGYFNNAYGYGSPLNIGGYDGNNVYVAQSGFPGDGYFNGRGLNGLSGYGNYGVYGKGIGPFMGYGFGRGLGGYNNLNGYGSYGVNNYGSYGIGGINGYGSYGIGGINGYGSYSIGGLNGYGSYGIGGLNGYGSYGIGGINGNGIGAIGGIISGRNHHSGFGSFGKFGGKKGTY
ncbi:unnamed protein product [Mytilus coruscus]|uniref:Uncharacterized protein n=1 Tax=Mytilus coruscus TaxID=42192 RepID=A0A6J8EKN2_MYTCO|nr:unnamed protein product [Mytilus coruscus]